MKPCANPDVGQPKALPTQLSLLLVEDDPGWQHGIQSILATCDGVRLIGTADSFDAAMALFHQQRPDVVLLDWKIQGERDGMAVGKAMMAEGLAPEQIILISGSPATSIPAHPYLYVPKNRLADELSSLLATLRTL